MTEGSVIIMYHCIGIDHSTSDAGGDVFLVYLVMYVDFAVHKTYLH